MNKREIKRALRKQTDCAIQYDGWPCGTCFCLAILKAGVKKESIQNLWSTVLYYRGDYKKGGSTLESMGLTEETYKAGLKELKELLVKAESL